MKKFKIIIINLVLLVIFGIAGMAIGNQCFTSTESHTKSKNFLNKSNQDIIKLLYHTYIQDYKTTPKSLNDLMHTPDNKPLLDIELTEEDLTDPWGSKYRLVNKDDEDFLISNGPDKKPDTKDDSIMKLTL